MKWIIIEDKNEITALPMKCVNIVGPMQYFRYPSIRQGELAYYAAPSEVIKKIISEIKTEPANKTENRIENDDFLIFPDRLLRYPENYYNLPPIPHWKELTMNPSYAGVVRINRNAFLSSIATKIYSFDVLPITEKFEYFQVMAYDQKTHEILINFKNIIRIKQNDGAIEITTAQNTIEVYMDTQQENALFNVAQSLGFLHLKNEFINPKYVLGIKKHNIATLGRIQKAGFFVTPMGIFEVKHPPSWWDPDGPDWVLNPDSYPITRVTLTRFCIEIEMNFSYYSVCWPYDKTEDKEANFFYLLNLIATLDPDCEFVSFQVG